MNIHDEIDNAIATAIEELRKKYAGMPPALYAGQVSGLLIATAVKLARDSGCAREVLTEAVAHVVAREYSRPAKPPGSVS